MAKVTLVPCFVNLTGTKWNKAGIRGATINNAMIFRIVCITSKFVFTMSHVLVFFLVCLLKYLIM